MTKSKSPSLASFQGTRPLSGTYFFLVFVSNGIPSGYPVVEPAAGFRMETILLASSFLSFPLLFKHPGRRLLRSGRPALSQARKIIYPSQLFCQYPELLFFVFFRIFFHPSELLSRTPQRRNGK